MKFLCVACDEAMSLRETRGPDEGSMTVVFACPACGHETAMLTNAMETQVVRSLGVTIGGRTVPAEPMEMVRGSLRGAHGGAPGDGAPVRFGHDRRSGEHAGEPPRESKCPFTGMVEHAYARSDVSWTAAARERAEKIPSFARGMAMKGVEDYARERGYPEISEFVLDEVRERFGF